MGRGEAAGVGLVTSHLCTMFMVSGSLGTHSPQHGHEGSIKKNTRSPAPLRHSLFTLHYLLSFPPFLPSAQDTCPTTKQLQPSALYVLRENYSLYAPKTSTSLQLIHVLSLYNHKV
ncbi:hypothetical protein AMECASPLE_001112 [Ameca splendens]|uniref:Secreted protein n=1 Tax=Ameca splendens TaxID=208324 RepID=A0ABV1A5L6_9TELE